MSYWPQTQITYSDTPMFDAFGRLRSSTAQTLHDSKLLVDAAPQFWSDEQISGSGATSTYSRLRASVTLGVSAATAGQRVRQTKKWFDYQPGKSQLIYVTFVMGAAATGITKRIGYYSTNNGIFLQQTSAGLSFVVRTWISGTPSDANAVAQANWNIDKLDGSGPSGKTLDITKSQIFFIDFEWLGVGRVKCGFVIDGLYVTCHQFLNANVNAAVYMSSPNLPVRYSIANDGTGGAATLECICSSVISEGGRTEIGYERAVSRGDIPLVTANDGRLYPLFAIRLNGSYPGAKVNLLSAAIAATTTTAFNWWWIENPQTVGSYLWADIPNSPVQAMFQSTTGSLVLVRDTGTIIKAGASAAQNEITVSTVSEMALGTTVNGVSDVWVIAVERLSTAAETFYGALSWREVGG